MKGILFKPDMVKAIVEGRKTQTRRLLQHQPPYYCDSVELLPTGTWNFYKSTDPDFHAYLKDKPRYKVGDVVYIKEAWATEKVLDNLSPSQMEYASDVPIWYKRDEPIHTTCEVGRWRSPLFMPAWAARYFTLIKGVGVGRLQGMTEEDAIAEGCTMMAGVTSGGLLGLASALYAFKELWDSINKNQKWDTNPFVFRYEFELVDNPLKNY